MIGSVRYQRINMNIKSLPKWVGDLVGKQIHQRFRPLVVTLLEKDDLLITLLPSIVENLGKDLFEFPYSSEIMFPRKLWATLSLVWEFSVQNSFNTPIMTIPRLCKSEKEKGKGTNTLKYLIALVTTIFGYFTLII
jgi:hypothetical protein